MNRTSKLFCVFLALILLSSCTLERSTDIFGFTRRVNKRTDKIYLDSSSYYYDGEGEYSFFVGTEYVESVLSLETDAQGIVKSLRLSAVKNEGGTPDAQAQNNLYDLFSILSSVLTLEDEQTVKNAFLENSFSPELLSSEDTSLSFEAQGNEYFVLSNERIISLYCSLSK